MLTILQGDALEKLRELPDESVQCCVTSPPFWGLRDYGTATWADGAAECDHVSGLARQDAKNGRHNSSSFHGSMTTEHGGGETYFANLCGKCGARRIDAQLGLEKTPEEYVARLVAVFREVRRILKADGTLWLNLGDSYSGSGKGRNADGHHSTGTQWKQSTNRGSVAGIINTFKETPGLKEKDLVGIPWMVAFALRADGWWLRSDIIWAKPNPMPESVSDRPTKAHEYIFLLTKSARYFYDADAIKEQGGNWHASIPGRGDGPGHDRRSNLERESVKRGHFNGKTNALPGRESFRAVLPDRNKRSVWRVATNPYPDAHFATYPPDLIKPCIMAGSKAGDVILDPFAGSGTSGMVALELGRRAILIELNPKYVALIEARTNITLGLALT